MTAAPLALVLGLLAAAATPPSRPLAAPVQTLPNGTVSLHVDGMAAGEVLVRVAQAGGLQVRVSGQSAGVPVWAHVPGQDALGVMVAVAASVGMVVLPSPDAPDGTWLVLELGDAVKEEQERLARQLMVEPTRTAMVPAASPAEAAAMLQALVLSPRGHATAVPSRGVVLVEDVGSHMKAVGTVMEHLAKGGNVPLRLDNMPATSTTKPPPPPCGLLPTSSEGVAPSLPNAVAGEPVGRALVAAAEAQHTSVVAGCGAGRVVWATLGPGSRVREFAALSGLETFGGAAGAKAAGAAGKNTVSALAAAWNNSTAWVLDAGLGQALRRWHDAHASVNASPAAHNSVVLMPVKAPGAISDAVTQTLRAQTFPMPSSGWLVVRVPNADETRGLERLVQALLPQGTAELPPTRVVDLDAPSPTR